MLSSRIIKSKFLISSSLISLASGGGYLYLNDDSRKKIYHLSASSYRIFNLVSTVSLMTLDYVYHLKIKSSKQSNEELDNLNKRLFDLQVHQEKLVSEYTNTKLRSTQNSIKEKIRKNKVELSKVSKEIERMASYQSSFNSKIHLRNAERLRRMCEENGGIYIKLGQIVAMLSYVIPDEYHHSLSNLLSNTPRTPYNLVRKTFRENFGVEPRDVFDQFDENPIASASLAQVHIAYKGSKKYAVKIQHYGLFENSSFDMAVVTFLVNLISDTFEDFNYKWLTKEMNLNIPIELDFKNERNNLEKCRKNLKDLIDAGDLYLPHVDENLSCDKVITMSFEEGIEAEMIKPDDFKKVSFTPDQVTRTIAKIFSEQIFKYGFVHCDPHGANILIRSNPKKRNSPQIVLLDHGLYRELDRDFRLNYCRLWQSLILSDESKIKKYSEFLNAGHAFPLLASVLTLRTWDDIISEDFDRVNNQFVLEGSQVLLASYAKKYHSAINNLFGIVPSELLLLLKTNDCLRHLEKVTGSSTNSIEVMAQTTSNVILNEDFNDLMNNMNDLGKVYRFSFVLGDYINTLMRAYIYSYLNSILVYSKKCLFLY